ncbi:hypothetical protein HDA32_002019 [Spinactinospora alkalitolerans]|uniref:Uncharacterized protein n=1 Tax=Spinactinospora alkalitolerans TaxID=687207 RepID=A0A852TSA7_9ACTN|nr:hypothetical protein [Spinactinospora alkalitolerans]NYE46899.1 hypothetical protein [Spinactinospora alkalitolerans]
MLNRRLRRRGTGGRDGPERSAAGPCWEPASYWLLYVVALAAALWHWRYGNDVLAVLCVLAVLFSVRLITTRKRPRRGL